MDLRQMRQFVAVAEELHFGKAAKRLNMAQPPLSQAIRRLELELGVELFDRSKRNVELTPAGAVFLVEARRTLQQAELARKMAQRAAASAVEVRVGFIGIALYRTLPNLIVDYRETRPGVEVRLFERPSADQVSMLLSGDLDVGFMSTLTEHVGGLETLVVERAAFVAAVPASWDLAEQDAVSLAELAERPFIMPPQKYAPHFSETLSMFKRIGVMPRVAQEATQTNTTISLVGAGLGCSIITGVAALAAPPNVKFLQIADAPTHQPWELIMTWASDQLSPMARDFVQAARDQVARHPELLRTDDPPREIR